MSRYQKVMTVLFCMLILFAVAPTGGAFAQTEGPFGDPTCGDYIDNDGDGKKDSADTDCYNNIGDPGVDDDGDGMTENEGDCNDDDTSTYLGAQKICDGIDNNCDGKKDFTTDEDKDNDTVPWCAGDCDDNNGNRAPIFLEAPMGSAVCQDNIDNDCDNRVDLADTGCQFSCFDSDGDGYGLNGDASCDFPGEIDCNDNNASVNPGVIDDSCNGIDNNCSGTADDQYVIDSTCGTGECETNNTDSSCVLGVETLCLPGTPSPEGVAGSQSCTDNLDNDCDGLTDTDPACSAVCEDFDEDGYGVNGDASCGFPGQIDCDDSNAAAHPGGDDANCNGIDEDCVGGADSGYIVDTTCGTGECNTNNTPSNCTGGVETVCQPGASVAEDTPGVGVCTDGVDNDCDGLTDTADSEGCSSMDVDDDGDGFTENGGDCNDGDTTMYPGAPKLCDAKDNNCDGKKDFTTDEDKDNDGVPWCASDCDDNNPNRSPNIPEAVFDSAVCTDGIDNDCDGRIDINDPPCAGACQDFDEDGYGVNGDVSCDIPGQIDCNDNDITVNPGIIDNSCNGIDNNCSGTADDGYVPDATCGTGECKTNNAPSTCVGGVETVCQPGAPVLEGPQGDATCTGGKDEDCDTLIDGNDPGCQVLCIDQDGDGYGVNGDASCGIPGQIDCDDSNAAAHPGGDDANCNGIDEDCAGGADSGYVVDTTCGTGECNTNNTPSSCGAGGVETVCQPGSPVAEDTPFTGLCIDGLDNDCDGSTDAFDSDCSNEFADNDGDGYCRAASCTDGSSPNDCDDTDPNVYPGAAKICDGKDSNCDGKKDFATDEDKDGDGVPWCANDCDDNNDQAYPGNTEGPFGDPTCSDGVDNDCQNGADVSDPACVVSCETKTNPKDGPHVETMLSSLGPDGLPNTADDVVHPENDNLLCGKCHGATLQDPIRYACDRCHTAGGTTKATYSDPWPLGFGSAADVQVHSSTVVGTKYGAWDMGCVTCHNPHLQEQDSAYGTSYGKLIKEYVCFDNPVTGLNIEEIVEFTAASGAGSFADGPPANANVCEMCHTQTNHHRREDAAPAPGGQAHNDSINCTQCHDHNEGFRASGSPAAPHNSGRFLTECELCHVSPTDYVSTVPDAKCEQCHTPAGTEKINFPLAPDVLTHSDVNNPGSAYTYTNNCVDCHDPMNGSSNLKLIRTNIAGSIVPGSVINLTAFSGAGSFADGTPYEENVCNTCHSLTNHQQSDGVAPGGQDHNNNVDCRTCHAHDNAFIPNIAVAPPHNPITDCSLCHVSPDYADPVPSSACNTCHTATGVNKGSYPTAPDVVSHQGRECVECHDPMFGSTNLNLVRTTIAGSIIPNSIITFTSYIGIDSFGNGTPYNENICDTCHSATNHHQSDGVAPGGQQHENGSDCRSCHDHNDAAGAWKAPAIMAASPHNAITDCNLCHVNGRFADPIPNSQCENCHTATGSAKGSYPTAPDVATHQGRNCIECHDPMYASTLNQDLIRQTIAGSIVPGSNIVYTSFSGAGSFADGAPYNENICETCHSATNHHQSDGGAPGGQDHENSSDCRTCHDHNDPAGAWKAPNIIADAPHNAITDCNLCHVNGMFAAPIPNSQCNNCHTATGANKGSYPTAPDVMTHSGSSYGAFSFNCVECHNPMDAQTNIKDVRSTIASSIVPGSNVVFTMLSGAGSFADGAPYNENICETCHSQTQHHQSDGNAPGGQDHENGNNCTTCHDHNDLNGGFFPSAPNAAAPHNTITDCGLCHTGANFSDPVPNSACDNCHIPTGAEKPNYPTAPDVVTHLGRNCVECHDPMNGSTNQKLIRTTIAGSIVPGSNIVFTALSGAGSFADGTPYNENICETCHSATNHHQSDGSAPGGQDHENGSNCTVCHDHNDANGAFFPSAPNAVAPHDTITDCTLCHTGPNFSDPVPNTACDNCHIPTGAEKANFPTAPDVVTHQGRNCVECHDPMNGSTNQNVVRTTIAGSIIPGSNIVFTTFSGAGSFADGTPYNENICETCHSATNHHQSDGSAPGGQDHQNGNDCRTCHDHNEPGGAWTSPTGGTVPPPHAVQLCNTCHVAEPDYAATIPDTACQSCHDSAAPGSGGGGGNFSQTDDFTGLTTGDAGRTAFGNWTGVPGDDATNGWMAWNGSTATAGTGPTDGNPTGYVVLESSPTTGGGGAILNQNDDFTGLDTGNAGRPVFGNWTGINGSDGTNGWMAWTGATASNGTGPSAGNPGNYVVLESSPTTDPGGGGGTPTVVNYHTDTGSGTYGGMSVNHTACNDMNPGQVGILRSVASFPGAYNCSDYRLNTSGSGVNGTWIFTTPYAQDTTIDGGTTWAYLRDRDDTSDTMRFFLGYVSGGTFTSFGSVDQVVTSGQRQTFTINMSGISGVAPAGSVLALQMTNPTAGQDRIYMGTADDSTGSIRMTVTETSGGGTGDFDPTNGVDVTAGSTQYVVSNVIDAGAYVTMSATFDWNMNVNANSDASLHLDAYNGTSWDLDITGGAINTGNNGDLWVTTSPVDLSSYSNADFQLRVRYIVGTTGNTYQNDVAVDNLVINGTGPVGDQDAVNGVDVTAGSTQYLESNILDASSYAFDFTFDFNMNVNDNADASLHLDVWNGTSWDLDITGGAINTANSGDIWITVGPVDLSAYSNADMQLRFRYIVGNGTIHQNDVAFDNLIVNGTGSAGGGSDLKVQTHAGSSHGVFSITCVECHNPMNTQTNLSFIRSTMTSSIVPGSNIVFTATSGAGSFADGTPYNENVCETCHSLTNHHQSDGTAPGGQTHEDNADCTTCHTHLDGFVPAAITVATPHNVITDCNLCHTGPNFSDPVPNTACDNCHIPTGAEKANYPTAPDVVTHMGRNCVECHDPMNGSTNQNVVRTTIAGSIISGSNVVFTAFSGAGSFADGTPYSENICETCHSATNHHQSDGAAPGGQDHENGSDCRSCHDHNNASGAWTAPNIVPAAPHAVIADCMLCHIGAEYSAPIPNSKCANCHTPTGSAKGSYPTAPDVVTHQSGNCVDCHNPMYGSANQNLVRTIIGGSIIPGSNVVFTAFSGAGSFADGTPYNENICETCHSATNHHQSDGTAPGGQDHENGNDCRTCHNHNDPNGAWSTSSLLADTPHNTITNCGLCHTGANFVDPIPNSACDNCHTPTGAEKPNYPTAPDVATHAGSTYGPFSKECVDCHNPMDPQTNQNHVRTDMVAAGGAVNVLYPPFIVGTAPWNGVCENCHTLTNHHQNDGAAPGGQSHNDAATCTSCHPHIDGFLPTAINVPFPHDTQDCNTCHTAEPDYQAMITDTACLSCHDEAAPGSGSLNQVDDFTGLTTGDAGRPTFGNWSGVNGTDATNGWMVWTLATNSTGTGPSDGNPSEYVVLETSAIGSAGGGNLALLDEFTGLSDQAAVTTTGSGWTSGTDSTGSSSNCWFIETTTTGSGNTGLTVGNPQPYAYVESSTGGTPTCGGYAAGDAFWLESPDMDASAFTALSLSFDYNYESNDAPNSRSIDIYYRNGTGGSWTLLQNITNAPLGTTSPWASAGPINLLGVLNQAGSRVRIQVTSVTTDFVHDIVFDNIALTGTGQPTCTTECDPDAVDVTAGSEQSVESGVLDASIYALNFSFDWNMNVGDNTDASLHLDAWNGTSWDLDITGGAINTGDNGDVWVTQGPVDLSTYFNSDLQLRIRYIVGNGTIHQNDIAVDNMTVTGSSIGGGSDLKVVTHDGSKHSAANNCVDCHNPMYDQSPNLKFIRSDVAGSIDPASFVAFTSRTGAGSFSDGAPYRDNICDTCHQNTDYHRWNGSAPVEQDHNINADCTVCHSHLAGFQGSGCTGCHATEQGNRVAVVGQLSGNSHHIQGVTLTDAHCYQCHWEATPTGGINATYHTQTPGQPVDLVVYGDTVRPTVDTLNVTRVPYTADGSRTEKAKINQVCLGCHDDNSKLAEPFGDGNTPISYSWDSESIDAKYSQTGTTTYGKYSGANTAPKNITKAYSGHGNAAANVQGWSATTGVDGTIPDRTGSISVLCTDCHNSHGSNATGTTTYYLNPLTTNGGMLKDVTAGFGGYTATYQPMDFGGSATLTAHSAGSGICFDCHLTAAADATIPWGYQTFGATDMIVSYLVKPGWEGAVGVNPSGAQQRYAYKNNVATSGGHFGASAALATTPADTIDGLCAACHDPHGVSPTLNQPYSVPMLKGTWMTSPYQEDAAPANTNESRGGGDADNGSTSSSTPGYHIDQNTFTADGADAPGVTTWDFNATAKITETVDEFGGLCISCHAPADIDPDTGNTWRSYDRIHDTVMGWAETTGGNANNTMHGYSCSKCHTPHSSCLPRLAITNCLNDDHRGRVVSGGNFGSYTPGNCDRGCGNGHGPGGGGGWADSNASRANVWNTSSGGAYFFGNPGTSSASGPALRTCHDNQTGNTADHQQWNDVTNW